MIIEASILFLCLYTLQIFLAIELSSHAFASSALIWLIKDMNLSNMAFVVSPSNMQKFSILLCKSSMFPTLTLLSPSNDTFKVS